MLHTYATYMLFLPGISVMADHGFTIREQLRDQLREMMMSLGSWLIAKKKETM